MTTSSDCAKALRPILTPLGFSRNSSTWRRSHGEFVDVIEFQREGLRFTVNIGVLTKSAYAIAWGEEAPRLPRAAHCTVHSRVAHLAGVGDKWWEIGNPAALLVVAEEVQSLVLPFLDRMHSKEQQLGFLRNGPVVRYWATEVYETILMFECGEKEAARAKITSFATGSSAFKGMDARYAEIAARLGCS